MLERKSALATATPYRSDVLRMGEARGFSLIQAAGNLKAIAEVAGPLPEKVGIAMAGGGRTVMRTGPEQFWFVGPESDDLASRLANRCAVTPLSHSRTRMFLEGAPARDVLAKGIPLDFHESVFKPATFAQTGLHHTPVLVHCVSETRFEVYALRTFSVSIWHWFADAALEFAQLGLSELFDPP